MIKIVVGNRVYVTGDVPKDVLERLRGEFTRPNPDRARIPALEREVDRMKKSPAGRRNLGRALAQLKALREAPEEFATLRESTDVDGAFSVPRGGIKRLASALRESFLRWEIEDARSLGPKPKTKLVSSVEPWAFQADGVAKMRSLQNCIALSPTGSGKSTMAATFIAEVGLPALVLVPNKTIANQWVREAARMFGLDPKQVGMLGSGKKTIGEHITIGMPITVRNMIRQDPDLAKRWGVVFFDECQRSAAETCYEVVDMLWAKYRFGLSADKRRKDKKDFLIHDLFGDVGVDVNDDMLVEKGFITQVEYRVVPTGFAPEWYLRSPRAQWSLLFDRLLEAMTKSEDRNEQALRWAREEVSMKEQVLLFSHRVEHCVHLAWELGSKAGLMLGGPEREKEFEATRLGFKNGSVSVAVGTYQSIGAGLDLPSVGVGIAVTPIFGNEPFRKQVEGRLRRKARDEGKTDAVLYLLWDEKIQGAKALRELVATGRKVSVRDPTRGWVEGAGYLKEFEDEARAERDRAAEG